ncbi:MAG: NADH-quinone oxidoreductase subunit NuoE [Verrucomicrobiota bacterium]
MAISRFDDVCGILDMHERDPARLITILQEVQKTYGYLPEEVLTFVATSLDLPPARVYGVATFYSHFTLEPKGENIVRLCDGTACHVKGAEDILDALRERLGLCGEAVTTSDQLFTVETVSCLGACGLAPVMTVNDKVYGQVSPEQAVEIVEDILQR